MEKTINSVEQIAFSKHGTERQIRFVSGFSFETKIAFWGTMYLLLKMLDGVSFEGNFSLSYLL